MGGKKAFIRQHDLLPCAPMKTRVLMFAVATAFPMVGLAEGEAASQLPTVVVTGTNDLVEETLFGPNLQPEWTAHRRFTNARVYVLPPWQIETEISWEGKFLRGERPLNKLTQEIEVGLPYRLQLDYEASEGNFVHEEKPLQHWRYGS